MIQNRIWSYKRYSGSLLQVKYYIFPPQNVERFESWYLNIGRYSSFPLVLPYFTHLKILHWGKITCSVGVSCACVFWLCYIFEMVGVACWISVKSNYQGKTAVSHNSLNGLGVFSLNSTLYWPTKYLSVYLLCVIVFFCLVCLYLCFC